MLSMKMSSMKELFPFHGSRQKYRRNFITENIKNAKGYKQCILEKRLPKANSQFDKPKVYPKNSPSLYLTVKNSNLPYKNEMRVVQNIHGIPKIEKNDQEKNKVISSKSLDNFSCQSCGQLVVINKQSRKTLLTDNSIPHPHQEKKDENISKHSTNYHQLSHKNEDHKINIMFDKCLDLSSYRKGEIPEYLKKRNTKLKKERQKEENRKHLAEILGFNDPKCPPGHMLMLKEQIKDELRNLENMYQALIEELNKMPVSCDSLRLRNRKIEIEKNLNKLDHEIELYRSGKVFIKIPN